MFRSSSSRSTAPIPNDVSRLLNEDEMTEKGSVDSTKTTEDDGILVQSGVVTYANVPTTTTTVQKEKQEDLSAAASLPASMSELTLPDDKGLSVHVEDLTPSLLDEAAAQNLSSEEEDDDDEGKPTTDDDDLLLIVEPKNNQEEEEQHELDTFLSIGNRLASSSEPQQQDETSSQETAIEPVANHHQPPLLRALLNWLASQVYILVSQVYVLFQRYPRLPRYIKYVLVGMTCLFAMIKMRGFLQNDVQEPEPELPPPSLYHMDAHHYGFLFGRLMARLLMFVRVVLTVYFLAGVGRMILNSHNKTVKSEHSSARDYSAWTMPELKEELRSRKKSKSPKLPTSGIKEDLVRHLQNDDKGVDSSLVYLDDDDKEPLDLSKYYKLTMIELKELLMQSRCPISGEKADLIRRLVKCQEDKLNKESRAALRRQVKERGGPQSPYKHGLVRTLIEMGPEQQ